ncbi:relaxin-3 receptor 1-like [Boleophthalmus pectinirostris]|uniref:relaxin-3 receptor 1-like n=1 Tax=Boleophthalmus pectinirostris TaxID=150288 RepID=UPI00242E4A5C|nr:relaxin-3 receptor 1-like [Boleophthalmus pectinirostris]
MSAIELYKRLMDNCGKQLNCNDSFNTSFGGLLQISDDGSPWLRTVISIVYFVVATTGVFGNLLVMFLLYSTRTITTGNINFFVFNLALADFLFSLALPFWAVDIAMDYSWPFGLAACKAVSLLTGLNVFASCFFLTAMSLARYCYVATALKPKSCIGSYTFPLATALIWAGALIVSMPRAVFADLKHIGSNNDTACLLRFPETTWLGLNQLLRVVLGFLLPYSIMIPSYLLLLRFLCQHKPKGTNSTRNTDISKSVAVVVLSFCACWFPYNVLTFWTILIQFDLVDISQSFYSAQTYFFPIANCLAFSSSCFNPVIYCLVRKEYRAALQKFSLVSLMSKVPYNVHSEPGLGQAGPLTIQLNTRCSQTTDSRTYEPLLTLPTTVSNM